MNNYPSTQIIWTDLIGKYVTVWSSPMPNENTENVTNIKAGVIRGLSSLESGNILIILATEKGFLEFVLFQFGFSTLKNNIALGRIL